MTTPDISRILSLPGKRYASARLQQGRILTDADFNESAWIREEDRRRCVLDFVGARGAPDLGFQISGALDLGGAAPPDLAPPLRAHDSLPTGTFSLDGE